MNIYALCNVPEDGWWRVESATQDGPSVVLTIGVFLKENTGWRGPDFTVKVYATGGKVVP